ncbi:hypothetical protein PRIPAC_85577 [Pristionchus pacificus]|uniref:Uncharacterized protein n=1 Tax=Pristionchus pacificus TaxID=54126 RepID=A0A2A6BUX7_PRIPA|nr:hypothetical protein PRIPAC_85577 [Pristionchus pacificus]|eukprot:PDM69792.1 hypothetical protein PRIPAC_44888 [Pristionchus pacificus]
MKPIALLLLAVCVSPLQAVTRHVKVNGNLSRLDINGKFSPVEEGYAQLWEYDFWDPNDHLQTRNITYTGHFVLEATDSDVSLEYFLMIKLPCTENGPLKICVDKEFKDACKGKDFAEFIYRFESNPDDGWWSKKTDPKVTVMGKIECDDAQGVTTSIVHGIVALWPRGQGRRTLMSRNITDAGTFTLTGKENSDTDVRLFSIL